MSTVDPHHAPTRGRWQRWNSWAGYLVFAVPAAAAVPAVIATVAQFGLVDTLRSAGPAALCACAPLLLWTWYTCRRPNTSTGKATWGVVGILVAGTVAFSPLFFWAGPAVLVVISELLRLVIGPFLAALPFTLRSRWQTLAVRRSR